MVAKQVLKPRNWRLHLKAWYGMLSTSTIPDILFRIWEFTMVSDRLRDRPRRWGFPLNTSCLTLTENINGALPNQDLINTVAHIAQWTAGVPVRLHSLSAEYVVPSYIHSCWVRHDWRMHFSLEPVLCPSWIPAFACGLLRRREIEEYIRGAKHLVQHAKYAALGRMSGAHGVFAR